MHDQWSGPELDSLIGRTALTRREMMMTTLAVGFAAASLPVRADTVITTGTEGLTAGEVKIPVADGEIPAYRGRPLLVGLSTMTCFQIKNTLRLAQRAREIAPDIPLVWGGTHPSMMAEQTLESEFVDFVVQGEGEQTLLELVQVLQNGKSDFSAIDGLGWKSNGKNILNKDRDFLDIEALPFPYDGKGKEILLEYIRRSTDTLREHRV